MASMQLVAQPGAVGAAPAAMWIKPPLAHGLPPANPVGVDALAKVNNAPRGVCRYFLVGQCRYGDACWLVHPTGGPAPPPGAAAAAPAPAGNPVPIADRKNVVCRYFQLGNCKFGDQCHYKHDIVDEKKESA